MKKLTISLNNPGSTASLCIICLNNRLSLCLSICKDK